MPLTRRQWYPGAEWRFAPALLLAFLLPTTIPAPARAQEFPRADPQALEAPQGLLLNVVVNGRNGGALTSFQRLHDGSLAATPADLRKAGIKPEVGTANGDGLVPLDSLSDVSWRYDEPAQKLVFEAPDAARVPTSLDLGGEAEPVDLSDVRSDFGFLLNYSLYGTSDRDWTLGRAASSLAGSFDARLLTPFGTGSTTAIARLNQFDGFGGAEEPYVRLDTSWRYTDPKRMLVYQVGDGISGGLSWTSSYRFGGVQFRRNFDIRPDLVTTPVPSLSGTASVPSTLDLYLNNIKVFSGEVPAGPYAVTGLPFLGGGGDARIVMKDELGREVVTQRAYFFAPDMLRPGLFDFSVEAGLPRLGYGETSFSYDRNPAGSASARYGLTDFMTLEAHAEATRGLVNGGAGAATSFGAFGALRVAAAASRFDSVFGMETGGKLSASYTIAHNGYSLYVGADRMLGRYNDVGLVVDRRNGDQAPILSRAREALRAGISLPLGFDPSSVSLSVSRIKGHDRRDDSTIASLSWSRSILDRASVYVSAYTDLAKRDRHGIFAGLTVPLGGNITATASASRSEYGAGIDASLTKSAQLAEGELGWAVRNHNGLKGTGNRSASARYRTPYGEVSGSVEQAGQSGRVTGSLDGAVVVAGGDVFVANRVDDAFAVVKAGGPEVDVSVNGRRVATTNSRGRAFVPNLQSYQNNRIAIDPKNLAFDLQPQETQAVVVPADRSGAVIDFGVRKVSGAVVILVDAAGKPVPVGSEIRLEGSEQETVAGYEGRVYLTGIGPQNTITATLPAAAGTCQASFAYQAEQGAQPEIGPVTCR